MNKAKVPMQGAITFHKETTKHLDDLQNQIFSFISRDLDDFQIPAAGQCLSLSQFLGCPADVLLPHLLADRNYLLRKQDAAGGYLINSFRQVWVAGNWMRNRLLAMPGITLAPDQIVATGAPRVDFLRRLSAMRRRTAHAEGKLRVLWAPGHEAWRPGDHRRAHYSDLSDRLARLDGIELTSVVHPRHRIDKTPLDWALIDADIVVSDYSSVLYEAWALGKPVVFPHWLVGEHVLQKAPGSAEAHIYRARIGYHPDSLEALVDLLHQPLERSSAVQDFIGDYLLNATENRSCIAEIRKALLGYHWVEDVTSAPSGQFLPASVPVEVTSLQSSDEETDVRDAKSPVGTPQAPTGLAVHFRMNTTRNYADVQMQIADFLGAHLRKTGFAVTASPQNKSDDCTIAMFIRDAGQVYIGHNLADKNYILQRDDVGEAFINRFEHVFVPGNWHRRRLLQSPHCRLRPDQIHLLGAPRVDYLREYRAARAQPDSIGDRPRPLNILWAPTHDRWTSEDAILSSYPAFGTCLDHPELAARTDIVWTTVLHPRNRDDKQAITEALIDADIVVSDYSSVLYEAWALGKPVIFPRWLLGDHVLKKAPKSAEAHIYRARIGYHPDSFEAFCELLRADLPVTQDVHDFMRDYLFNYEQTLCAERIKFQMKLIADPEFATEESEACVKQNVALSEGRWQDARDILEHRLDQYTSHLSYADHSFINLILSEFLQEQYKFALALKKWSVAEESLRELLKSQGETVDTYSQLADILTKQKKWWQAVIAFEAAIALDSLTADASLHFGLGVAQEALRWHGAAARSYRRAIELDKFPRAEWYYRLGFVLETPGHDSTAQPDTARAAYSDAIQLDTKLDSARFGVGVFHQARGYWQAAAYAYSQTFFSNTNDADLAYKAAYAFDRSYDWRSAELFYSHAILLKPTEGNWHFRLGFVCERQENYLYAALCYERASLSSGRHVPDWVYRQGYTLAKAGQFEDACRVFLGLVENPDIPEGVSLPWMPKIDGQNSELDETLTENMIPDRYVSQDKSIEQMSAKDTAIEVDQNKLEGDYRNRLLIARKALLKYRTTDVSALKSYAKHVSEVEGDWSCAADLYNSAALRNNAHDPELYYALGRALAFSGRYSEACEAFCSFRILQRPHGLNEARIKRDALRITLNSYAEYLEVLPLRPRSIIFESFNGSSLSCNPLAIYREMRSQSRFEDFMFFWTCEDIYDAPEDIRNDPRVFLVKRESDLYLRIIATCEYLVNNNTFPYYFIRREGQKYLSTWHGTPMKTLGKKQKFQFFSHKNAQRNFLQATHLISPNPYTTRVFIEDYDLGDIMGGNIAETGYPRIDSTVALDPDRMQKIRKKLNLDPKRPVILYAPTWRGSLRDVTFDTESLRIDITCLPKGAQVIFRGHSLLESVLDTTQIDCTVVPKDIDTNELLSIVDILITDYSSILFDFLPLNRPVILYQYDLEDYESERGLYLNADEMPGRVCFTRESLSNAAHEALENLGKSLPEIKQAAMLYCPYDDGHASVRVIDFLFDDSVVDVVSSGSSSRKNVVIYPGSLQPNGISSAYINLQNALVDDQDLRIVTAFSPSDAVRSSDSEAIFAKLRFEERFVARCGYAVESLEEGYLRKREVADPFDPLSKPMQDGLNNFYQREFQRLFSDSKIDFLIAYSGYEFFWQRVIAAGTRGKKIIFLHNDMNSEFRMKWPNLNRVFGNYAAFDIFASVSEGTNALNRESLATQFDLDPERFRAVDNLLSIDEVLEKSKEAVPNELQGIFSGPGPVFITLGRLSVEKDHAKLLEAFVQIKQEAPLSRLLILGDGPLRSALERKISQFGLQDSVFMPGHVANPFPMMKAADCFVLSSNHEGQPMVLLESMLLGIPIVATDIIGNRGLLEGRGDALVENSVDGLVQGLRRVLKQDITPSAFDPAEYQRQALEKFKFVVRAELQS